MLASHMHQHSPLCAVRPALKAPAPPAGGLHAALRGPVPFVRDGVTLLHKEGFYELGASPLALLWKDATCSRYHLDTDAAGVMQARQTVTLQCLPCGGVGTSDKPPHVLARLPDAAAQQLGDRARRASVADFTSRSCSCTASKLVCAPLAALETDKRHFL